MTTKLFPPNYSNNPNRMHTGLFSSSVTLHRFQPTSQFPPKILVTRTLDFFSSYVTIVCVTYPKNLLEPRFQPTSQFPPENTYHMHTGLFFFMCDHCLRDIQKYLTASLSWWLVRRAILLLCHRAPPSYGDFCQIFSKKRACRAVCFIF